MPPAGARTATRRRRRPQRIPGPGARETAGERRARLAAVPELRGRPAPFDARDALRRAGFERADDLAKTGGLAEDLARRGSSFIRSDPTLRPYHPVSFAELAVFAAVTLLALALLDTALKGRGPAAVERILAGLGGGIRRLFDPRDPLIRAGAAPAFVPPILGTEAYGDLGPRPDEGAGGERSTSRAGGIYPLGRRGKLIGTPHAGTHTVGNWQSDNAVDLGVPVGTPVYAVQDGVIGDRIGSLGSSESRFAGLRLTLEAAGNSFYYAHLSRLVVRAGQRVREGQLLGYSGTANGVAHLHFGVRSGSPFQWAEAQIRRATRAVRRAVGARER